MLCGVIDAELREEVKLEGLLLIIGDLKMVIDDNAEETIRVGAAPGSHEPTRKYAA